MVQQAEVVFAGGAIYTADATGRQMTHAAAADGRPATAMAVAGGRIAQLGDVRDRDVRDLIGPGTTIVDLRGRALLPGFQDAHVHPAFAGITMIGCNLMGASSLGEALARIAAYGESNPEREWIAGSGWPASTATLPTRRTAGSSGPMTAARRARCTRARPAWSATWCRRSPSRSGWRACWPRSGICTRAASPRGRTRSSGITWAARTRCRCTWRRRPAAS